ncbi:MAG TPA: bile acid:sodium symporter, partial [Nitrosospira sp.]|nr:bile acid:sodium symporter [Nitrosospira sp.]
MLLQKLTLLFPLWMILSSAIAMYWPESLIAMNQGSIVVLLLAFIMLCMGLTLSLEDFRRIAQIPRAVAVGFAAQYSITPLMAWAVAHSLDLPPSFAVGLILVGCCPGGTASNLVTYIAGADVAL